MPAQKGLAETIVQVHVAFGLHCFTKKIEPTDCQTTRYGDDREQRTFENLRYELSKHLPEIVRTLAERHCAFAKDENYVTVNRGSTDRYGVFFNIKRLKDTQTVLLVVQSAYPLDLGRPEPGSGKIRFNALLGHALRGTRPKHP